MRARFKIALTICLSLCAATAALWLGLDVSFLRAKPAFLFGIGINHDLAMALSALTVAGIFLLPLPTLLLLLIYAATKVIQRNRAPGLCPTCGYDLRATPDRCPECGAVPRADHRKSAIPLHNPLTDSAAAHRPPLR
jgi:hypothetical protein